MIFCGTILAQAGTETSFEVTWPGALWGLMLLWGASCLALFWSAWRQRKAVPSSRLTILVTIRLLALAVLAWMLLGYVQQEHRTNLPDLVIILDDSASMGSTDAAAISVVNKFQKTLLSHDKSGEISRLNLAKALLLSPDEGLLPQLEDRYNVKIYLAGASARPLVTNTSSAAASELNAAIQAVLPTQSASRLAESLREVIEMQRGRPTAGIIMLTDGVTTEGGSLTEAAQYARRKEIPLFFLGMGNEHPRLDLLMAEVLVDEVAFLHDSLTVECRVQSTGYAGAMEVRLLDALGQVLAQEQAMAGPNTNSAASQTVRLRYRPSQLGKQVWTVEVSPVNGEADLVNNRQTVTLQVIDETLRVLLVQAYPSYEFRFLKTMLERELNQNHDDAARSKGFRTVLQEADADYVETDKSAERVFPVSREELFAYDVIILGDVNPALLSPVLQQNICDFVTQKGGGLICFAGPRYLPLGYQESPLAAMFPFDVATASLPSPESLMEGGFQPQLSPLGVSSPPLQLADDPSQNVSLWQQHLPPLRWFVAAPDLKPGVRVLLEHPTRRGSAAKPLPLITQQFLGAGKVVFHFTDETHRWRFRVGDTYFARYWIQTIRHLSRAKAWEGMRQVELATDRKEYRQGEDVRLRIRFLNERLAPSGDDGVTVLLERDGGQRTSLVLPREGASRGRFEGVAKSLAAGSYRASLVWSGEISGENPVTDFQMTAPPGEMVDPQLNSVELKSAAEISRGKFYTAGDSENLVADLPIGRQIRIESLPPQPLWNHPWVVGLLVGMLSIEWFCRRQWGLP